MELTRNEQCELNTTTIVFDGGSSTPDIRQSISAGRHWLSLFTISHPLNTEQNEPIVSPSIDN